MGLMALTLGACNSDEPEVKNETELQDEAANLDFSSQYAQAWTNYAKRVALLLKNDAQKLHSEWTENFAETFRTGRFSGSYNESVQQILDGCIDIANEVGTAKIGEPYDYMQSGHYTQALYAVESWYSWHSRDDYSNNIRSIANSLTGMRIQGSPVSFTPADAPALSILGYCWADERLHSAAADVWQRTCAAWTAIQNIPQPFRNHIGSTETTTAMQACEALTHSLEVLKALMAEHGTEAALRPIVEQYVDAVVLPTYTQLEQLNAALYDAVVLLGQNPTDDAFATACMAWLAAREPWETSEAFLFGPVDELGLDPNMDSWPLDQVAIVKILTSGNYDALDWAEGDNDQAVEAAQALRGFHTLEFLLFKDGRPRRVQE